MKKFAFTVAEVLVALTVIGIISALSIPTFTQNTAKSQYITAFKATMNQLQTGATMFKAENGYDFAGDRTNTNGATIIGNMLTTKLNAKATSQTWDSIGGVGYMGENNNNVFALGSSSTITDGEGNTLYQITSCGCTEDNPTDINDNGRQVLNGEGDMTCSLISSLTPLRKFPCYSTNPNDAQLFRNARSYPFLTSSFSNELYANGTGIKDNANVNSTYNLPSGITITVLNTSTSCNYRESRWQGNTANPRIRQFYRNGNPDQINSDLGTSNVGNFCLALVDVNGAKGPNRIISCGTNNNPIINPKSAQTCTMKKANVTDIFPIWFYDDAVMPANAAAYTAMYGTIEE